MTEPAQDDPAAVRLVATGDRPDLDDEAGRAFAEHWPEFVFHDLEVKPFLGPRAELFGDWDFYALDAAGRLVGAGYGVPIRWDTTVADLPAGYTDALRRSVTDHGAGVQPDTLVVMGAVVRRDEAGRGRAGAILRALRDDALARGLTAVLAPVRPTSKHRYPLTDIEEYVRWRRPDGLPLDPWLRAHARIGGEVVGCAPRSQTMTGTVRDWEQWTGLDLPASGGYVIPDGLSVLHVDREAGTGVYVEPNVWVRHA